MADPLAQVADQYAPAPLNFFDAGAAESIISRHANSRRGLAATEAALGVASRAQGMQSSAQRDKWEADRQAREAILRTREDEEYAEKKQADAERGGFIVDFVKNVDPKDPDYTRKVTEFMAQAPPAIQKDQTTRDVISFYNREADQVEMENRRKEEIDTRFKNELEKIRIRTQSMAGLKGVDPETIKKYTLPDGSIDPALYYEAGKRERELEMGAFKEKTEVTKEARKELLDVAKMDDKQKARFNETKLILIENKEAFPDETDLVRQEALAKGKSESLVNNAKYFSQDKDFGQKFQKAQERDRDKFAAEVNAAKRFKTPEEFVEARGAEISEEAKEARRRVWEYAHQNDEESAPATKAGTPREESAPATKAGTPREEVVKVNGKWIRRRWVDE